MSTLHTNHSTQHAVNTWWDSIADYKPLLEESFREFASASRDDRKRRVKELMSFYRKLSQSNHPAAADTLYVYLGQMVLHLCLSYEVSLRQSDRDNDHYRYAQSELLKFQQHLSQHSIIVVFA